VIGYRVKNAGKVRITRSTVTVRLTTSARTYLRTDSSDLAILPGSSVVCVMTLPYLTAEETAAGTDCAIDSDFFE
jgi:hypothetical protein